MCPTITVETISKVAKLMADVTGAGIRIEWLDQIIKKVYKVLEF